MAARGIACGAVRAQRTHPCGFRWAIPGGEQHERHHDSHNDLGGVYENYVVQELVAHGFDAHYYSGKRVGELDAVVERDGDVLYLPLYLAGLFSPENAGFVG